MNSATSQSHCTLAELNQFGHEAFVRIVGPVFERSPWIASAAWSKRPFASPEELHRLLCDIVSKSSEQDQLALINAHPDLAGRAALAGTLTPESTREQASAGLTALTPEELAVLQRNNQAYRDRFGFPFVICARLNQRDAIQAELARRLENTRPQEIQTALEEIFKIAKLRLRDLIRQDA